MSRVIVFDASALIAYIKSEPGNDVVDSIIRNHEYERYMHPVNLCEVSYHLLRFGLLPMLAFDLAYPPWIEVAKDFNRKSWQRTAELKADYQNLALADCIVIALAESMRAEILTSDRFFQKVDTTARIRMIR